MVSSPMGRSGSGEVARPCQRLPRRGESPHNPVERRSAVRTASARSSGIRAMTACSCGIGTSARPSARSSKRGALPGIAPARGLPARAGAQPETDQLALVFVDRAKDDAHQLAIRILWDVDEVLLHPAVSASLSPMIATPSRLPSVAKGSHFFSKLVSACAVPRRRRDTKSGVMATRYPPSSEFVIALADDRRLFRQPGAIQRRVATARRRIHLVARQSRSCA
jgi:hypothetical protein